MTSHFYRCVFGPVALSLVIAGCAGNSDVVETAEVTESSTTVTVVETTIPPTPSTVPRATCPADESGELLAVIEAQTFAISQRDFVAALTYSSASFRSNTTVEQFERMISYEYGFLLKNPSVSVTACQLMGDSRDLLVELGTDRRHVMAYVLSPDEGQWRIDVAALLGELDGMTA
ncbi:MAG: DUF4864 domain-containing protein [Ilumatobacteraceae bacterium]